MRLGGSPNYVRSILVNIISNAIKYTNPGGDIFVSARELSCDGEYVKFEFIVSDTGIGMSEEFAEHIFEPFTQEHAENRSPLPVGDRAWCALLLRILLIR